jgi:hypothetical protein
MILYIYSNIFIKPALSVSVRKPYPAPHSKDDFFPSQKIHASHTCVAFVHLVSPLNMIIPLYLVFPPLNFIQPPSFILQNHLA